MQVTGIGGIFFRASNPEVLSAWYHTHFGIWPLSQGPWRQTGGDTVFMPFPKDTDYFPAAKQWMINFRVDSIETAIADLQAAGIEVITNPEWDTPETGRFARVSDPEGNQVELWQPPD